MTERDNLRLWFSPLTISHYGPISEILFFLIKKLDHELLVKFGD